ncbi:hypothetical protein DSL92_00535 [Billgrantia gudaonensis]|uniref:Uncharacterized protein n=1 Tax=Billgrantia gudaonensis TaxID=376427 RepID=A0A432JKY3_9GAMM|nr:hypothetical protein DSL92_00535 [Halomonas gudaonensis]
MRRRMSLIEEIAEQTNPPRPRPSIAARAGELPGGFAVVARRELAGRTSPRATWRNLVGDTVKPSCGGYHRPPDAAGR